MRPLRGLQAEVIKRNEEHVMRHDGGVMVNYIPRQVGKNQIAAELQRRHLFRNQCSDRMRTWIRTAPTHKPQIVNSKKRLRELMNIDTKWRIRHPIFEGQKLVREEGYIWKVGNASVEFLSSGPNANVVGATASECLDMDEAHKVRKEKFDEDFMPFTADQNSATLLWGVAADGLDTMAWYYNKNIEDGNEHLNVRLPCEIWMESNPVYAGHVNSRVKALGWDHPIIKTQYRLIPVAAEGRYLNEKQVSSLLSSDHERQRIPRPGTRYEALIDFAGGNEDFNPKGNIEGNEDTATDSTVVWIYEVSEILCANGIFPIVRIVDMLWSTGANLPAQEEAITAYLDKWYVQKITADAVGIGRQLSEKLELLYGPDIVNKYTANSTSVSEDLFDLQARLNYGAVKMFQNDSSPEWAEFERQCNWTKYASSDGKMKLVKPGPKKHIDMVKALTYLNQNKPAAGVQTIIRMDGVY